MQSLLECLHETKNSDTSISPILNMYWYDIHRHMPLLKLYVVRQKLLF